MHKLLPPLLLAFFILIFTASLAFSQQTLHFATMDGFRPFTWLEDDEAKGIDVDIITEMCARMKIKCVISFYPWKRVLAYVKKGLTPVGFSAFQTPDRMEYAHFPTYPIHYSTYSIFVRKGHEFPFQTIKDLYGKKIGMNRGFNLNREFNKAFASNDILVEEVATTEKNLIKLLAGRLDGIAANKHETLMLLKEMNASEKVVALSKPLTPPRAAYLMLSKKAKIENKQQLIEQMDETLKGMYDDGVIDHIHNAYLR